MTKENPSYVLNQTKQQRQMLLATAPWTISNEFQHGAVHFLSLSLCAVHKWMHAKASFCNFNINCDSRTPRWRMIKPYELHASNGIFLGCVDRSVAWLVIFSIFMAHINMCFGLHRPFIHTYVCFIRVHSSLFLSWSRLFWVIQQMCQADARFYTHFWKKPKEFWRSK